MEDPLADVTPGMTATAEVVVTEDITVGGHVAGMPFVYGTPFMILLMEVASGRAIGSHLAEGWVSVGSEVNVRHLAPTPLGRKVIATSRVLEKTRRSVLFAVEARDGERLIGDGTHRRGVVDLTRFGKEV